MPGSKMGIALAVAIAMASSTPAFAGMNGTESLNRIQSAQRAQSSRLEMDARAAWPRVAPSLGSDTASRPYPHRYYGGPKSFH